MIYSSVFDAFSTNHGHVKDETMIIIKEKPERHTFMSRLILNHANDYAMLVNKHVYLSEVK
jgi:hypothetical protein